jgi:lysophospholipase L1-like esterase
MSKFLRLTLAIAPIAALSLFGWFKLAAAQTSDFVGLRRPDPLPALTWWWTKVNAQASASQNQQYATCLFGDSISSALEDTIGNGVMNFAMGGLSTVSLVEQLKIIQSSGVKCQTAVIAIGTNDAMYATRNETFVQNLTQIIGQVRNLGATQVVLLPAFYSTLPASFDPNLAGTIERVDEINALIRQVAVQSQVPVLTEVLQPLFRARSLRTDLTFDGVHLNEAGKTIYRGIMRQIVQQTTRDRG